MMDINFFTNKAGPGLRLWATEAWGGWEGGIIHLEKWENHKNSTHSKIKFCIFFSTIDIKIFTYVRSLGLGAGRGHYPFSIIKKSQEHYLFKIKFYIIFI